MCLHPALMSRCLTVTVVSLCLDNQSCLPSPSLPVSAASMEVDEWHDAAVPLLIAALDLAAYNWNQAMGPLFQQLTI